MCCMCDPFLTSVRLRCFQEMYKKMELQTFFKQVFFFYLLGWLNTLALVWHPAIVANHYETHNKR